MAAITVGVAMQAAPAAAADHERRVVVSIPDRMLALIESDQVIAVFGIHGTDDPRSIGFAKSHGCIRLRNEDVEVLFEQLRAGDVVELHDERTPEIQQLFAR